MKSRITIDFKGVDAGDGNQLEPVIRVHIEDSDDVRDGLFRAFFQALGGQSNWLVADIWSTGINNKQVITISPVKPSEFQKTIDLIKDRLHGQKELNNNNEE